MKRNCSAYIYIYIIFNKLCNDIVFYFQTNCTKHAVKIVKKATIIDGKINNLCDPYKITNEINIIKSLQHVSISCIIKILPYILYTNT